MIPVPEFSESDPKKSESLYRYINRKVNIGFRKSNFQILTVKKENLSGQFFLLCNHDKQRPYRDD